MFGNSQRDQNGNLAGTESTSNDDLTSNAATKSLLLEVESVWNASRGNESDTHHSRVGDIQDGAPEELGSGHGVSKSSQRVDEPSESLQYPSKHQSEKGSDERQQNSLPQLERKKGFLKRTSQKEQQTKQPLMLHQMLRHLFK